MKSKRSHEGYLFIDHRGGPGMPGIPLFMEAPTITCSHCQTVFIVNPLRNRERAYCSKCDHYICDKCGKARAESGGECKTFKQIIDEVQEAAVKAERTDSPIILPI